MRAIRNSLFFGVLVGLFLVQGCASLLVYETTRKELLRERAFSSGDEALRQQFERTGTVPTAFAPTFTDVVGYRPGRQTVAAAVDAGLGYLAYLAYDEVSGGDGDSDEASQDDHSTTTSQTDDSNVTVINIDGDDNVVNQNGDQTSTPAQ